MQPTSGRILWGYQAQSAYDSSRVAVYTDFDQVVNPHVMICGDSGTGKTHTLRQAINELARSSTNPVRFHIFDVHGDIEIPQDMCSTVMFSETSPYGLNPLKINPDPDYGGVRKCIQNFINILSLSPTTGRALGPKQQDVLRNLLLDVFAMSGFDPDDSSTWLVKEASEPADLIPNRVYIDLPFSEKDLGKKMAESNGTSLTFDSNTRCWHVDNYEGPITRWPRKQWGKVNPTLSTLVQYATRRREMSFTGTGQREAALLETVHRKVRAVNRALQNSARARNNNGVASSEDEKGRQDLDKAKADVIKAFSEYISNVEHGNALEAMLKYDSFESLSTVKQIIDSLNSSGIFRDTPPNFDARKPVWRYHLKAIRQDEQKFMVNVRLREIFDRAVQRGESDHVREVIVIDEGAKFVEDDDEHIINIIALEARKFGLAIWFASQSPTQYPDTLLSTVATKVILGLDKNVWPLAQRKLGLDQQTLGWIRPREGVVINCKLRGQSAQPWVRVITPAKALGHDHQARPGSNQRSADTAASRFPVYR